MAEEVFENYTGEDIVVTRQDGTEIVFPSLGNASISCGNALLGTHASLPIRHYGRRVRSLDGVPPPREGVRYIIPLDVFYDNKKLGTPPRVDVVTPDAQIDILTRRIVIIGFLAGDV